MKWEAESWPGNETTQLQKARNDNVVSGRALECGAYMASGQLRKWLCFKDKNGYWPPGIRIPNFDGSSRWGKM